MLVNENVSSFANYLLIHGLLQQLYVDQHASTQPLRLETVVSFETALRMWQASWKISSEFTLDPITPKGRFGISVVSLLQIAYIRLSSKYDLLDSVVSSEKAQNRLHKGANLDRLPRTDRAVIHAAHALSIQVRHGISFIVHYTPPSWSIETSVSGLESALLLTDWVEMIVATVKSNGIEGLRDSERSLLRVISGIIKETEFAESLEVLEDDVSHFQRIATILARLWIQICQRVKVLGIDQIVETRLQNLANFMVH